MGARLLKRWLQRPLLNLDKIKQRQEAIGQLASKPLTREELRDQLKAVVLEMKEQAYAHLSEAPLTFKQYIRSAFRKAVQ